MKICKKALYAQVIDNVGSVRTCAYSGYYILGNLRDNSFEELFENDKAKEFFRSLAEGTYEYCNEENCPYMANHKLESMLVEVDSFPKIPTELSLSYDRRCNYKCTCCCSNCNDRIEPEVQQKIENEIEKILPNVETLSANGLGEFFVSDSIMSVVNKWEPKNKKNAVFFLETNGSLFNEKNWNKVKNIGNYQLNVAITVMSFEEAAYKYLSGTSLSVDNIVNNLKFVKRLRDQNIVNKLEIATVFQERNFRTLPEFTERCLNEFGADSVRLRRFLPEKAMDENIEWFFDIRNPLHPYHKEYLEVMKNPIFENPKVWKWTGDALSNRGDIPAKVGYNVLTKLFLQNNVKERLTSLLLNKGYRHIVLYAVGNLCKATIMNINKEEIVIDYILDAHTKLKEFEGIKVKTTTRETIGDTHVPILVTLASRHKEMKEYIENRGFKGEVLSLVELLDLI